jgi:hypothetical protein
MLLCWNCVSGFSEDKKSNPESPFEFIPYIKLFGWGLGVAVGYKGINIFDKAETSLWASVCVNYEDNAFFRNPDESPFNPAQNPEIPFYKRWHYGFALGIMQGFVYDEKTEKDLFSGFLFFKNSNEINLPAESPAGALIFSSGLPDQYGLQQYLFSAGIMFNNAVINPQNNLKQGFSADAAFSLAPKALNSIADYTQFTVRFTEYIPIVDQKAFCLYLGCRSVLDISSGAYIPVSIRTSTGGFSPFFSSALMPGLGGGVRGILMGRFDGYVKLLNNFEIRMSLPEMLSKEIIPLAIIYFDTGTTDNLDGKIDFRRIYASAGIGLDLHINLLVELDIVSYLNFFINERAFSFSLFLNTQF